MHLRHHHASTFLPKPRFVVAHSPVFDRTLVVDRIRDEGIVRSVSDES